MKDIYDVKDTIAYLMNKPQGFNVVNNNLIEETGVVNQPIRVMCANNKKGTSNGNSIEYFWGLEEQKLMRDPVTHVAFYSEEDEVLFIFDTATLKSVCHNQSRQTRYKGRRVSPKLKYNAVKNANNEWSFNFPATSVKWKITPHIIK